MAIILRNTKGSELTFTEVDDNFSSLLYDVALSGDSLIFYRNDGNDIIKRTIDLSGITSSSLIVQFAGSTKVPAADTMNFTGAVVVTQNPNGTANIDIQSGSGTSGNNDEKEPHSSSIV